MAEYGGLLRQRLVDANIEIHELAPALLKKFATGKGNADKSAVVGAVAHRYGVVLGSSDEYDAYVCARIAGCLAGWWEPDNNAQREVLAKIKNES